MNNNTTDKPIYILPEVISFKRYNGTEYYVSEIGMVYSFASGKFLKGYRHNGYLNFDLYVGAGIVKISQHRILAECFIPNPQNLPLVRHLNDNRYDVRLENLAWGTKGDNMDDAVSNGLLKTRPAPIGEKNARSKLTESDVKVIKYEILNGVPIKDIAEKYGVCRASIYCIREGKNWGHVKIA